MVSWLLQAVALATYRNPLAHRLARTRGGSALFVASYDLYKTFLEVPGNQRLARQIRPTGWVIDVGANIGFFSERFARWVSNGGRVIAVEPDERNVALLQQRLARRNLHVVDIHQVAATRQSGPVHLLRNPDHPGDHRLSDAGDVVPGVTLDELVAGAGNPVVDLIKIDTQGSEGLVLDGAIHTLQRSHPSLFIEVDDSALRQFGSSAAEIMGRLQGDGYRFYRLSRSGREVAITRESAIEALSSEKRGYLDLLCVHASRSG